MEFSENGFNGGDPRILLEIEGCSNGGEVDFKMVGRGILTTNLKYWLLKTKKTLSYRILASLTFK